MDFIPQMSSFYPEGIQLPYFMAYPEYPCISRQIPGKEEDALQDFEYFRRTYPKILCRYQKRVEEMLDRLDYEGSMIYDEYPDRVGLNDLGNAVAKVLSGMAETQDPGRLSGDFGAGALSEAQGTDGREEGRETATGKSGNALGPMEELYLQGLAQVLLCNEIYRRRQKKKGKLFFQG